jgi:hypothetical protein
MERGEYWSIFLGHFYQFKVSGRRGASPSLVLGNLTSHFSLLTARRRGTAPVCGSREFLYAYGTQANPNQIRLLYELYPESIYLERVAQPHRRGAFSYKSLPLAPSGNPIPYT